jgi:hypothetical protein
VALTLAAALGTTACSAQEATSNVATHDTGAAKACDEVRQLARASVTGRELRDRVARVYNAASESSNPVIRARAVALYTDATQMAEGAESGSFRDDLAAMQQACSAPA